MRRLLCNGKWFKEAENNLATKKYEQCVANESAVTAGSTRKTKRQLKADAACDRASLDVEKRGIALVALRRCTIKGVLAVSDLSSPNLETTYS